jgi:DNA-binding XRE family transcriptional regulator
MSDPTSRTSNPLVAGSNPAGGISWSGRRFCDAREAAGLTQEQLAPLVGVVTRTIVRWERGSSEPRGTQARHIAGLLGCDVESFYYREEIAA